MLSSPCLLVSMLLVLVIAADASSHRSVRQAVSNPCNARPCLNGGECYSNGARFVCLCPPAFIGTNCAISQVVPSTTVLSTTAGIDFCVSSPCQRGASCIIKGDTYKCICGNRYTGKNCETAVL